VGCACTARKTSFTNPTGASAVADNELVAGEHKISLRSDLPGLDHLEPIIVTPPGWRDFTARVKVGYLDKVLAGEFPREVVEKTELMAWPGFYHAPGPAGFDPDRLVTLATGKDSYILLTHGEVEAFVKGIQAGEFDLDEQDTLPPLKTTAG
jgi:hypothetical protein